MQNAKDSFYIALRNRLATVNPARVMTLRGTERPGIFVEEAEIPIPQIPNDVFVLRWTNTSYDNQLPLILIKSTCEVLYASSGSATNSGLDRGRALAKMDQELMAIAAPPSTPKLNYSLSPAQAMETMVFWTLPTLGDSQIVRDRIVRTTKLMVFSFEEQGEL